MAEQTLDERIGDVRAVMDAAGSERSTIYGWSEGGPLCLMFSATHPDGPRRWYSTVRLVRSRTPLVGDASVHRPSRPRAQSIRRCQ